MSEIKTPLSKEERKAIIDHIVGIIEYYGSFNTAEVQSESSPIIATIGNHTCQLAEEFYSKRIKAVTYTNEVEVNTDNIYYFELSDEVLQEIDELAIRFEEMKK